MAVPPKFAGLLLPLSSTSPSSNTTPHTLEFYLDYVCPFSSKIYQTLETSIIPLIKSKYTTPGINIIIRPQIQPWHPSSTLVHESAFAILRLHPQKFYEYSSLLFTHQKEYFDVNVVHESRNETYKRLADLAGTIEGVDKGEVYKLLEVSDKPDEDGGLNVGNGVTNDVKFAVKMNRLTGVHVTPSVLFDGVLEGSISSGWGVKEWEDWLERNAK